MQKILLAVIKALVYYAGKKMVKNVKCPIRKLVT